jgi:hypothetical protein
MDECEERRDSAAVQLIGAHLVLYTFRQLDDFVCFFDRSGGQGKTVGLDKIVLEFPGKLRQPPGVGHGVGMLFREVSRPPLALHAIWNFRVG